MFIGLGLNLGAVVGRVVGWITDRRDQTSALCVTVSAPVVTQTRDEAGALHLTIKEPQ